MPPPSDLVATRTVGLIGARGHVGRTLLGLLDGHRHLEVAWASSSSNAGAPIDPDRPSGARFANVTAAAITDHPADVYVLATPDGGTAAWVEAIDRHAGPDAVIVDLSADHRFDAAWTYGLPEHGRDAIRGATRIANPGCYATAIQLALRPLVPRLAVAHVFGVSGYSGAGATPSPRNDPARLHENVIPYRTTGHGHEREVRHRLGRAVRFLPHVASFFRGILVTASVVLEAPTSLDELDDLYDAAYGAEPLVDVVGTTVPLVRDAVGRPGATVGGFAVDAADPRTIVVHATIDNLLKGAAAQALQNINLATGVDETEGLHP